MKTKKPTEIEIFAIRVEAELKRRFEAIARRNERSAAAEGRVMLRQYVEKAEVTSDPR